MQAISTPSSFALAGGSCLGRNRKYAARRGTKPGAAPRAAFRAPVAGPRDDAGAPVGAHRARPHRQPRSGNGPDDANAADAVLRAVAQTRASTRAALAACRAAFDAASSSSSTTRRDVDERSATPSASAAGACVGAAGLIGPALGELSGNPVFMSAFWAWLTAQLMKYVTTFYREGKWDWRVMFDSGGMPSSHSSLVVGLTTAIAYGYGLSSTLFPLSLAFSLIVMYDAAGVRRHAGKQAEVLNRILEGMVKGEVSEKKLKEVLGHSPLQVFAGSFLGVLIGIMYMYRYSGGYGCLA